MRTFIFRTLPPLALQLITVFLLLVMLETYFPGEFWHQLFFGFMALVFLNVMFDWFLRKFYKVDTAKGSGYSTPRNREVSRNYLVVLGLFILSFMGAVLSQGDIAHVIWAGAPLCAIWALLLRFSF